ncbi:diphthine synthase [Candidatus Woesearchaeota archaeon]|nr:diphthine synthase [Candidatus Woesearchaeota archaeon]
MALYLIGIGLNDEKDITVKGLEAVRKCSHVFIESYSSVLSCSVEELEKFYGKKVVAADREMVEQGNEIVDLAQGCDVALLVIGDPLAATTHIDIMLRAYKRNIPFYVINNASIITSIGITGLQVYKFGKITSVPFPEANFQPVTAYEVLRQNRILGLHTLLILDLKPMENRLMTVNEAVRVLLGIEDKRKERLFSGETLCVGCARIGRPDSFIRAGAARELLDVDFGMQPHCLVVPGELHFVEEEALSMWMPSAHQKI